MAGNSNKIQFEIGSIFTEEGFKKLNNALKTAGKETNNVRGLFGGLLNQASQIDNGFGQMAGKVSGVVQAFAQMGVVGGVLAVVKEGVDMAVSKLKEMEEEYDNVWKKMNDQIEDKNIKIYTEKINGLKDSLKSLKEVTISNISSFDQMATSIATMSSAIAKVEGASGNYTISQMLVEQFNEMMKQETDAGMKAVQAKYDLAIAEEKAAQEEEANLTLITEARRKELFAKEQVENTEKALSEANDALKQATEAELFAKQKWSTTSSQYTEAVGKATEAQNTVNQLTKDLANRKLALRVAEKELEASEIKFKDANLNAELSIKTAQANYDQAMKAVTEAAYGITQAMIESGWDEAAAKEKQILLDNMEAQSAFGLTQQETTRILEMYQKNLSLGMDADLARMEVEKQIADEKLKREKEAKEIELLAKNSNTNLTAAKEAYTDALEQGYTDQEAYNVALKSLKESAEGLSSQMETSTGELKDGKGETKASANVSVSINPNDIAKGTEETPQTIRQGNDQVTAKIDEQATITKNLENTINTLSQMVIQSDLIKPNSSTTIAKANAEAQKAVLSEALKNANLDEHGREALLDRVLQKKTMSKQKQERMYDYFKRTCEATEAAAGKKK